MSQSGKSKNYFDMSKGLVTDALAVRFPENATVAEMNMLLNRDGSRQRRPGMDYEIGGFPSNPDVAGELVSRTPISMHIWENANNDPNISLCVVQIGPFLRFYNAFSSAWTANQMNGGSALSIAGIDHEIAPTQLNGKFIIPAGRWIYILSYDPDEDEVTVKRTTTYVRDIWGVESTEKGDVIRLDRRPTTLDDTHKYNLYNQGWAHKRFLCYVLESSHGKRYADVLDYHYRGTGSPYGSSGLATFGGSGWYPSNVDIFTLALGTTSTEGLIGADGYNPRQIWGQALGNSHAPRGHFLIDPFHRSWSRQSTTINSANVAALYSEALPEDRDDGGLTTAAAFAQRVFYTCSVTKAASIATSPNMNSTILFSKIVDSDADISKCHSEADPTAAIENALVATDGGTISIPQASNILKLIPTGRSLLVVATNGVWEITSIDGGFSATSFEVNKITNEGCVSRSSIVEGAGNVFYWSTSGINVLGANSTASAYSAQSITDNVISSFYADISILARRFSHGLYDPHENKVRWLYNGDDDYDGETNVYNFNRELVFDLNYKAFHPNTIAQAATEFDMVHVAGAVATSGLEKMASTLTVTDDSGDIVVDSSFEDVTIPNTITTAGNPTIKYLAIRPAADGIVKVNFAEYLDTTTFTDWDREIGGVGGVQVPSYVETGYELLEDQQRKKQGVYLSLQTKNKFTGISQPSATKFIDGASGCTVTAKWEFSDTANTNKWMTPFEGVRLRPSRLNSIPVGTADWGEDVVTSKTKLRGRGIAFRMRFEAKPYSAPSALYDSSTGGYDMHIMGWGVTFTAGNSV